MAGAVGCERAQQPWGVADGQLAASARVIADKAEQNDVNYFRGLTADREKLPDLMEQVARSGIATNYAEHLEVESDTDATLVYRPEGDLTLTTPFTVLLSLHNGKARVDQIILGERNREAATRLGSLFERIAPLEMTAPPSVSVALAPGPLVAGTEQSALISYANTLDESLWVSWPMSSQVIIVDAAGERAWVWGPFKALDPTGAHNLAPFESAHEVVRFTAPASGSYIVFGRANGVLSSAMSLTTVEK